MTIEIGVIAGWLSTALAIVAKVYAAIQDFIRTIEPIIDEAEVMAHDGEITKEERRKLVTNMLNKIVTSGKVQIPWYVRPFTGMIIDKVAKKLSEYQIKIIASVAAKELIDGRAVATA